MNDWDIAHFHADLEAREIHIRVTTFFCLGAPIPRGHAPARYDLDDGGRLTCPHCNATYVHNKDQHEQARPEACALSPAAARAARAALQFEHALNLLDVQRAEEDAIAARRRLVNEDHRRHARNPHAADIYRHEGLVRNVVDTSGHSTQVRDTVGLAASGGGIRAAALALGALQALQGAKAFARIDYLSSVSGGGYMSCCYTAALQRQFADGQYPIVPPQTQAQARDADRDERLQAFVGPDDHSDVAAVAHIRDYSNYLMPKGFIDLITSIATVARGLVVNVVGVLAVVLLAAALTIWLAPDDAHLLTFGLPALAVRLHWVDTASIFRHRLLAEFALSLVLLGIDIAVLLFWAAAHSSSAKRRAAPTSFFTTAQAEPAQDKHARWPTLLTQCLFFATAAAVFLDIQPAMLRAMFHNDNEVAQVYVWLQALISKWALYLAPIGGVLALARGRLADMLQRQTQNSGVWAFCKKLLVQAAIFTAGMALPLLVWSTYLNTAFWGIGVAPPATPTQWYYWLWRWRQGTLTPEQHAPPWLSEAGAWVSRHVTAWPHGPTHIAPFYLCVGLVCLAISMAISDPNAISLHRLYRYRLAKTFLFDPLWRGKLPADDFPLDLPAPDLTERESLRLSAIAPDQSPYHIINAALNLEGSRVSNRRGRNADFFTFTRDYVGSDPTGYTATTAMEAHEPNLDLATAMAISGAAVSSNMGAASIKWLRCTLALLNLRLGYWMTNPARVRAPKTQAPQRMGRVGHAIGEFFYTRFRGYMFSEMFGKLDETSRLVYLTDGGHIENLGLYQLLKRKCQLIIVIDAEADPTLSFPALMIAERYARIDLGVRLLLPWQQIRAQALSVDKQCEALAEGGGGIVPQAGPHCAIGKIFYPGGEQGLLLYVKSSLSGDENDYILNYKARNPSFPHETTIEQFFSEEQFEAYRWLGYHAMSGIFTDGTAIVTLSDEDEAQLEGVENERIIKSVLAKLGVRERVG